MPVLWTRVNSYHLKSNNDFTSRVLVRINCMDLEGFSMFIHQ